MTSIFFLILSIWVGFIAEDYLDLMEGNFWVKSSFAIIIGSMLATWLVFTISVLIGFNKTALFVGLLIMSLSIGYVCAKRISNISWFKERVLHDKSIAFSHVIALAFIMPFFVFGLWETKSGDIMYLGNYTDLSYHMSIVSSFLEQINFPPENPQCAGAKISYHFLVNFHSAILNMGGFSLFLSIIIPQILFSFALATMLYYFYRVTLKDEISTFFSVTLFIMGHIAFFNILFALLGHPAANSKLNLSSWHSIREHLLFPFFNFMDPVINYFHPQRPFLFAFPLALIVFSGLYKMFLQAEVNYKNIFCLSLLVGLTPLFHIHSFLVLAPIVFLVSFCMRGDWKRTVLALLPLALAVGQIWYILSQPKVPGFSGFDVHTLGGGLTELNILDSAFLSRIVFWIRAAGFPLILGFLGLIFYFRKNKEFSLRSENGRRNTILLIFFTIPFLFFLLINFYRFSPNWGDSNKFFLYFDLVLALFAGRMLGSWFKKNRIGQIGAAATIMIAAILPSSLEAYGIFTRNGTVLFSACDRSVANWIRLNTAKDAIFLTSDNVIHYVPPLSGRRVVNGAYTWNTGFRIPGTDSEVRKIYRTGDPKLLEKYRVTHILVGPQEKRKYAINDRALDKYKLVYDQKCREVHYKVYDVRQEVQHGIAKQPLFTAESTTGDNRVFISDMTPITAIQDHGGLQLDANFNMEPIILNGKRYKKGLGTHANSEIVFDMKTSFTHFDSHVGLDDTEDRSPGSIVFKVFVDGKLKHKTPVMRWDSETEHIRVNVEGAQELKLTVENAGDGDTCDHASWADAMVY